MAGIGTRIRRRVGAPLLAALLAGFLRAAVASAHEVRPAYLELREVLPDTYDVLWKVPARGEGMRLALRVEFPDDTRPVGERASLILDAAHIERWRVHRPDGLAGQRVTIEGLASSNADALIRVTDTAGITRTLRATPSSPSVVIPATASRWQVSGTYLALGIEHIVLGFDHLLFLLALVLLVRSRTSLLAAISSFTIAHTLTLALAVLGVVRIPAPPVEACIALSIAFVAAEIIRRRTARAGLADRHPWLVAFTFGLLHGLGFAGALSEVGLPPHAIPLALLFFNVGVELGQIAFVLAVLGLAGVFSRLPSRLGWWSRRVAPYAIGSLAMYWVIERTAMFFR